MRYTHMLSCLLATLPFAGLTQEVRLLPEKDYWIGKTIDRQNHMNLSDTGTVELIFDGRAFPGKLLAWDDEHEYRIRIDNNRTFTKTFIQETTTFGMELGSFSEPVTTDTSVLTGQVAVFRQSRKGVWSIDDLEGYPLPVQEALRGELQLVDDADFWQSLYPASITLGKPYLLSRRELHSHFGKLDPAQPNLGRIELVAVEEEGADRVAVLNFEYNIYYPGAAESKEVVRLELRGTVRRSLLHFIDKETIGTGTLFFSTPMDLGDGLEATLTMKGNIRLRFTEDIR